MSTGSVLARREYNEVTAAVASSRFERPIGLLLHDCKTGDALVYDPFEDTKDIAAFGKEPR
jgi:hypothetical protein